MAQQSENERREQAFLGLIKYAEFGKHVPDNPYQVRFGNFYFMDMSKHPKNLQRCGVGRRMPPALT